MGTVFVDFDAGLWFRFGIGVTADVRTSLDDKYALVELRRHALGDRQAEETGTNDKEVEMTCGLDRADPGR
ncbi:uncharacterized protein RMCB_4985 [Mycolicibacterium brisbanense]|uniref:Uncharacterized protein n=1 Tax=Mycolicibacterium brisbanense TaxID=146020 RepID=A0A124E0L4_9MYCO|nr:uncharacterized protein RMCB_4985 [Mycolicibacterium brisbanense]